MARSKTSGKVPRTDPYAKLLHRFYEPLILSRVLGQTRGKHTSAPQNDERHSSRRRLLSNLAYLCDYDKGGDMTSAVALEDNDQCHVFWVASNTSRAGNKNLEFLQSSLKKIHLIITLGEEQRSTLEAEFTRACIDFAEHRVKKEANLLSKAIRDCQRDIDDDANPQLATWLKQFVSNKEAAAVDICFKAYGQRKASELRLLDNITHSGNGKTSRHKSAKAFGGVRHLLGRLAHHVRAPKEVIEDSLELDYLFDPHQVCLVKPPPSNPRPQADSHTKLDGILKRMLPAKDPQLKEYTEALTSLDRMFQLTQRVRNEPVQPESHQKIYLNWGVPELANGSKDPGYIAQRDLMNKMLETIRKDALAQIIQKAGPLKWHPDSLTGITVSTRALPADRAHLTENALERELTNSSYDSGIPEDSSATGSQTVEESSSPSLDNDDSSNFESQDEVVNGRDSDSAFDSEGGVSM
ncbi:hypothetical protein Daesc_004701 [Daldinia eschscholtzii]|uniref:Uncharacterized protein n=1 Tax=Daldinia eschscholtzii TaxID=292717 RepID=A0AAX6MRD1_9PEZI